MNTLITEVLEKAKERDIISPTTTDMPMAYISSAELYITFNCNDKCEHCITESGGNRKEIMSPKDATRAVENIATYSILHPLRRLYGNGTYHYTPPSQCEKLDEMEKPPKKLSYTLMQTYNVCAIGREGISQWVSEDGTFKLNFRKPAIRLSGGEFFMWPKMLDGKRLSEDERLVFQENLIREIRSKLPDYDVWILTNGRFATDHERTDKVIRHWAKYANTSSADAKMRICMSIDAFHRPPHKSTIREMVGRIWSSAWKYGLMAPHLYGIPNQSIGLIGRALDNFHPGKMQKNEIKNVSKSSFNPLTYVIVEPYDLVKSGGCMETKGFVIKNGEGVLLGNNVFIAPSGHLVYCCACVGDYGDFINNPEECMKNIVTDPLAVALRNKETVVPFLKLATELDPTITIFGTGENAAVTGSTCYQMLSGKRINNR